MPPESLLKPPPPDLTDLPTFTLGFGTEIYRVHRADREPWFFDDGDEGRFNLPVGMGTGTCSFAADPVGGFLEVFGRMTLVSEEDVAKRGMYHAAVNKELVLADFCAPDAGKFGINGEIHTTIDYAITRAWAIAVQVAGLDGIRYLTRSDPQMNQQGYAIFGPAGPHHATDIAIGDSGDIEQSVLEDAENYGVTVLPPLP